MRKIVAIINQKGGVGKTTTSINLSAGVAMEGHRVLIIDLDPQAHSTIGLGVEPSDHKTAIHDVLLDEKKMNDMVTATAVENLFLLPSHITLDRIEQQLVSELFRETYLHNALDGVEHDFIFIDCRPALSILTINALYACDFIIVPCEMGRYALDGFSDLMETIRHVKKVKKWEEESYIRILLNKFDVRNKVTNEWVLEQLEPFKNLLFKSIVRRTEAINQAHIAREPIFLFKPRSQGGEDFSALVKEFLELWRP